MKDGQPWFNGFESSYIPAGDLNIFIRRAGRGVPVLLLHGFPETHLMWRHIAPLLSSRFCVVCADLPGYGQSGCPEPAPGHGPHSKRSMARILVQAMDVMGYERFHVIGHDRGARVAYRMALDYPERIGSVAVLDIIPTVEAWSRADADFALGYWPWTLLAQAAPLPELLILSAPDAIVDDAMAHWGAAPVALDAEVRAAYIDALSDPVHVQAICEEYRAAAGIDRVQDIADQESDRRISCPLLALWSSKGALGSWYGKEGGPLEIWKKWADQVEGHAVHAGHFFPEEQPRETAELLLDFLDRHVQRHSF